MKFSTAEQKIKLRANAKPRFERIRVVEKHIPQEVRLVFQKPLELFEPAPAEMLMPCGMRYQEPFRARPNFFIPIMAVSSYVLPFFLLMALGMYSSKLPGFVNLTTYAREHHIQIVFQTKFATSLGLFSCLVIPMAAGATTAYVLAKNTKLTMKMKVFTWLTAITVFTFIEIYFGAFLSGHL